MTISSLERGTFQIASLILREKPNVKQFIKKPVIKNKKSSPQKIIYKNFSMIVNSNYRMY